MVTADILNNNAIKYRKELMLLPIIGLKRSIQHMTLKPGIQWKERFGHLFSDAQFRPHNGNVNKQNGAQTIGRELETFVGDIITEEDPEALRKSIYGEALLGNNKNLSKHPLGKLILAAIMNSASKNLAKALFKAVRNDAGTTSMDLFNGFDSISAAEITATNISSNNGNFHQFASKLTEANVVDELMQFYQDSASDELQDEPTKMFLPKTIYNLYNKGYKNEFSSTPYNTEYKKTFLEGTDNSCELVPLIGKKNSDYIQLSTKQNMMIGVDQVSDSEYMKVRDVLDNPWLLQFVAKMNFGAEFESIQKEHLLVGKFDATQWS